MSQEKGNRKPEKNIEIEKPPVEAMSLDVDEHPVEPAVYDAETAVDLLEDALEEKYLDEVDSYADMPETDEAFAERQSLSPEKSELQQRLKRHQSEAPYLSGGDVDAAWDQANDAGSETVGGTAPTPGQNDIDAMGKAMGIEHERNEPLNISQKRQHKDDQRWELNPESAAEETDDDAQNV